MAGEDSIGFVDLFCGAGGFTWGWTQAGFQALVAVDNDIAALRSHELNFGRMGIPLPEDLRGLDPRELRRTMPRTPRLLAIIGGPPCQGWSRAGRGKIKSLRGSAARLLDDPRNQLYGKFLDVVDHLRAPLCVMENVPGMLAIEGNNVAPAVAQTIKDLGYSCTYSVVNARWFGVPQDRKRLIFVGVRRGSGLRVSMKGVHRFAGQFRRKVLRLPSTTTVRQAIYDLPPLENGALRDPLLYTRHAGRHSKYAELMRDGNGPVITDHVARMHNDQDIEAFSTMAEGAIYRDLDERFKRYRDDIFFDKYRRLHWDRPSWTITAHLAKDGYSHIHPGQNRTLSIREAARLQSFPDSFRFFGNIGDRFRQIGNAVPPLMAWGLAEFIKSQVESSRNGRRH